MLSTIDIRQPTSPRGRGFLVGLVLAVGMMLGVAPVPAAAAVPTPTPGVAWVNLKIGSDRTSVNTIDPLPGEVYGLFPNRPTHFTSDGVVDLTAEGGNQPLYQCTSDAQGDCNWRVPIGTGSGSVSDGTRLWTGPITLPTGYYANPAWQTGPLSGTASQYILTPRMFQTPALHANQVYEAGNQWITTPGIATDTTGMPAGLANGTSTAAGSYRQRISSGGVTVSSRNNPPAVTTCGRRVALIVDLSSSMRGQVASLVSALNSIVDSLRGTPSELAMFTFSTNSPAINAQNYEPRSVATTVEANAFKALYAGWNDNQANGYTNWDAAFYRTTQDNAALPARRKFDTAILLTDGNPTAYGSSTAGTDSLAGYTRFRELDNAVASANVLKAQGVRVLAFGVGAGLEAQAGVNLRAVSGTEAYDGSNLTTASYFQETDYTAVAAELRKLFLDACAPSISVIKQIIPPGGTVADAYTPSEGWVFSASATNGATVNASPQTTDATTGGVNFDLTIPVPPGSTDVTITEDPKTAAGYTPVPDQTVCVNKTAPNEPTVPITPNGLGTGFTIPVGQEDAISCLVYNQAPADLAASVVVGKVWQVRDTPTGPYTEYAEQSQPPGLQSQLLLGGPAVDEPPSNQPWGDARGGYTAGASVDIQEQPTIEPPGCTLTRATIRTGTAGPETDMTGTTATVDTIRGENAWTVTNYVTCASQLTLAKQVLGGPAAPTSWTLHAIAPDGALPGPLGASGSTATVSPNVTYQLAEQPASTDPDLLNYVQDDYRTRPLLNALSTGSMHCAVDDAQGPELGDDEGTEGSVVVPLGQNVTCTATNRTATLTAVKTVDGGSAAPGDFTMTLTPLAPHPDGLPSATIHGAAAPGTTVTVRPGQTYQLTETGATHYQLASFVCSVAGGEPSSGTTVTIPAGNTALNCTATNAYSVWTATKSSDPATGSQVKPGSVITYTVTATRLDGAPTLDARITDDLSGVLDNATFVAGSLSVSTGTATLNGTTLTWTIGRLADTETLRYQVRVNDGAYSVSLRNRLTSLTTTEPGVPPGNPGDQATPCAEVPGNTTDCAETTNTTTGPPVLANTGVAIAVALATAGALLVIGAALVRFARRRPTRH
jgi:hypothetical protein